MQLGLDDGALFEQCNTTEHLLKPSTSRLHTLLLLYHTLLHCLMRACHATAHLAAQRSTTSVSACMYDKLSTFTQHC